jgi:hypothetical protein
MPEAVVGMLMLLVLQTEQVEPEGEEMQEETELSEVLELPIPAEEVVAVKLGKIQEQAAPVS